MRRAKPPTAEQAREIANRAIDGLCPTPMERWRAEAGDLSDMLAESFRLDIDSDDAVPSDRIVDDLRDLLEELS